MKKMDTNDPKWTAYALGEIADAQESATMEQALRESPELRALVDDIRITAGLLKNELLAEPDVRLTPAQRDHIAAKATAGKNWFGWRPAWALTGAAAAIALIFFLTFHSFEQSAGTLPQAPRAAASLKESPQPQVAAIEPPKVMKEATVPRSASKAETIKQAADISAPIGAVAAAAPLAPEASSHDTKLSEESVASLPLVSNDVMDLIQVMGGVVKVEDPIFASNTQSFAGVAASNINIQRDGITVNEMRYNSGLAAAARINPETIGEFKAILSPVDAEMGRSAAQVRMPAKPHEHAGHRDKAFNTETYDRILDNPFLEVTQNPLSTFSIDVDTASYANVRRFLNEGKLPPKDAVRIEELINYFDYEYRSPQDGKPFAANFEMTEAPWNPDHRLLRIALKGREIAEGKRPDSNLVFLLDVSGSMMDARKLPLVKQSMRLLVDKLTESDRVAIVVYASNTQVWLPSTSGDQKEKIRAAIDRLSAGGSTNGASGIQLAYQAAQDNFIRGGVNRIILCTDGDFNVGVTNRGDLTRLIEEKSKSGIYLSALGFGMGNYKDATLETLANKGHGNYSYIDTENEARKVLVEQIHATLVAIAKDVKIQVEFNPKRVSAYRLIGYEDRLMAKEDFNDDTKEAGVIGAGHAVTALYELVPGGMPGSKPGVDPLKYQKAPQVSSSAHGNEVATVKIRSKEPEKDTSVLTEFVVKDTAAKFAQASSDFKFAAAVAAFGMVLRDSPHKGKADLERALDWAKEGKGPDSHGYRQEFIRLAHRAFSLSD